MATKLALTLVRQERRAVRCEPDRRSRHQSPQCKHTQMNTDFKEFGRRWRCIGRLGGSAVAAADVAQSGARARRGVVSEAAFDCGLRRRECIGTEQRRMDLNITGTATEDHLRIVGAGMEMNTRIVKNAITERQTRDSSNVVSHLNDLIIR